MAQAALMVGWGSAVRGRERKALDVCGEAVAYYAGVQQAGEIESFEPMFLDPHGGDLNGFFLVRGSAEQIGRIRAGEDFLRLNTRAALIVENFGVVVAAVGDGIQEIVGHYQAAIDDLT